jgi:hypothetical protein
LSHAREFVRWTAAAIDEECADSYAVYKRDVNRRHLAYFKGRPEARNADQPWAASARRFVFPEGWDHLADLLPEGLWHRFHLFGGSSQTLAIGLLAAATEADPTLDWLPGADRLGTPRASLFEVELAPHVLKERPRQTTIDWLILSPDGVIAVEAKFTEKGFGTCRCEERSHGICSERVLERPYWHVASTALGLYRDQESGCCPLSLAYQPVRNIAAASAIAGSRGAVFLLLYDARNPYFTGARDWPGWVTALESLAARSPVPFRALSWQELLGRVDVGASVRNWAHNKHGLETHTRQTDLERA